ncbi:MAG: phosphatidylinositol kinase [Spirochaetes bacterium GWF1_31_7]|nr:MAG: phosphatidylinositol kinase [Spirochaetes bacterium GWE1_32_154]OHD45317.1 MAG: phosphatidylinositol kinase [Spirochaetes bacterium GWE2_31_10]OHD50943.1 MAG: phosphatidylinositol kinase [Spirochaetes bacterium GWF1_31_7]OHD78386.1 MAG: phosphatidylinositol kinase [Spirochaetes bacterium RIFOXYB1_FULL_32_8]HBD94065.1 phosphatidylinositol kinase [Spirochaetia bacterium]
MNRTGKVYVNQNCAGIIEENDEGYLFTYDKEYINSGCSAVSFLLPVRESPYKSKVLFPFFDGLIPEGWLLDIAEESWKINRRDRMLLLLTCCKDCIGDVSVIRTGE